MTQIYARPAALYYLVVVSPVLTPGVIIGISTVIFWKDVSDFSGAQALFTTASSWPSSASRASSRLLHADHHGAPAALRPHAGGGGARSRRQPPQVFWHILLPFLVRRMFSAAVIAFLSSFENYNTTTFAILADKTLTTVLAGRVRAGMTPAISAMAVLIIAVTVAGAIAYEVAKARERSKAAV